MPLINLTTDLKSLQYGNDRPGGGSSGLPYIVSPRPDQIVPSQFSTTTDDFTKFYELNRSTQDYPIRGGSIEISGETGTDTTPAGQIDRNRIRAFMKDPQKGKIFLLKQVGLQLTNPKTQVLGLFQKAGNSIGLLESTRYYDPTGLLTLLQTSAQGTGVHLPRHGNIASTTGLFVQGYDSFVRANNDELGNRLLLLKNSKLLSDSPITQTYIGKATDYGISILNSEILNYEGGPGSTYGIGSTIIKRATDTNTSKVYSSVAFSYDTIANQNTTEGTYPMYANVQDFRKQLSGTRWYDLLLKPTDYKKDWIQNRLETGNPGGWSNLEDGYDRLNALPPFSNDTAGKPWELLIDGGPPPAKDMVKFVFECMSNDIPGDSIALIFRSFLTGITDNHQAEFNSFKYLGRGETFRTYQGFDRSISFSFKIAAFSGTEMKALYTKLNHLVSQVYPDYSPTTRFMRGNVIKLTIGDYLYRLSGFLESVNITIEDNASWEIALNDSEMRELPQMLSVQCSFKPIHDILPRRARINDEYVPLIANTPIPYLMETVATGQFNFKKPEPVENVAEQRRNNIPPANPQFQPVSPIVIPDAPLRNRTR